MLLKAPRFWYKHSVNEILRWLLSPFSKIYGYFAARNYKKDKYRYKSKAHVVAIGGITVGGSGKTPVVASICEILSKINRKAAVISRGYGRSSEKDLKVDHNLHTSSDVGDEPLMLSKYTDVFVSNDRVKSAKMAEQSGHNLLLLDDGLTQKDLQCDKKIVVVDSTQGFGNGEMLPLGPNRLSFNIIKQDLDSVVIIQAYKDENIEYLKSQIPKDIPLIIGYLEEDFSQVDLNKKYVAFCGIGYPKKFFNSLKKRLHVVQHEIFPDHHPYSDDDIVDLLDEAHLHDAKLVTTEKDFCRIPRRYHALISIVPVKVIWKDTAKIAAHLNLEVSQ